MASSKRVKSKKPALQPINSWQQADEFVRAIGIYQADMESAKVKATEKINKIKAELDRQVKERQAGIDLITRSLEAFCVNNRADFKTNRSRKLTFGVVGWRKSTSVSIKKKTLELIKKVFSKTKAYNFIHVKETTNKEALAKLTDEQLASVGAKRKVTDDFFAEPAAVEVAEK